MTVFELLHTYYVYKGVVHYSLRTLGFFRTLTDANKAIAYLRTIIGYRDAPNGFVVRRRMILGEVSCNTIFEALVYSHSHDYENYEYTAELGLFGSEIAAKNALDIYRKDNRDYYNTVSLEIEEIVNTYQIDSLYCKEGFMLD